MEKINFYSYVFLLIVLILVLYFKLLLVSLNEYREKYLLDFSRKFDDILSLKKMSYILTSSIKKLLQVEFVAIVEYLPEKVNILSAFPYNNIGEETNFSSELFSILKNLQFNNMKYIEKKDVYSEHFKEYLPLFDYNDFKIIHLYSDDNKILTLEIYGNCKRCFQKNMKIIDEMILIFQNFYFQYQKFNTNLVNSKKNEIIIRFLDRIRNSLNVEELEKIILEEIARIFNADRVYFMRLENDYSFTPVLTNEYLANPYARSIVGNNLDFESVWKQLCEGAMSPPVFVIESAQKFIKQNSFENTPISEFIEKSQIKSSYPFLFFEDTDYKTYVILQYTRSIKIFTNDDFDTMELIVKQSCSALKQALIYSKLKQSTKQEKLLKEIYSETVDFFTEKQLYSYFAEKIMHILDAIGVVFAKISFDSTKKIDYFEYFKAANLNLNKFKNNPDIINMLMQKQLLYSCEISSNNKANLSFLQKSNATCFATIPVNDKVSILIFFDNKKEFSSFDKNIMSSISNLLSKMLNDINKSSEVVLLREKFLSTLSHDLYVPLIAQRNAINILLQKNKDENLSLLLNELKTTNAQTEDILSALTLIYKYESEKMTLNKSICNLKKNLEVSIDNFKTRISQRNISILLNVPEEICFWGDLKEILKVFKIIFMLLLAKIKNNFSLIVDVKEDEEFLNISFCSEDLKKLFVNNSIFDDATSDLEYNIGEGIYWHLAKLILMSNNGKIYSDNTCVYVQLEKVI